MSFKRKAKTMVEKVESPISKKAHWRKKGKVIGSGRGTAVEHRSRALRSAAQRRADLEKAVPLSDAEVYRRGEALLSSCQMECIAEERPGDAALGIRPHWSKRKKEVVRRIAATTVNAGAERGAGATNLILRASGRGKGERPFAGKKLTGKKAPISNESWLAYMKFLKWKKRFIMRPGVKKGRFRPFLPNSALVPEAKSGLSFPSMVLGILCEYGPGAVPHVMARLPLTGENMATPIYFAMVLLNGRGLIAKDDSGSWPVAVPTEKGKELWHWLN